MSISRKLGILVFFGVPAIIGGGIIYWLTYSYPIMFTYQAILVLIAGAWVSR